MAFVQLIYVSDLVNRSEAELGPILESAERHNGADGITGMLLYNDGNFLQVLEGTHSKVRAAFERIRQDARHGNITVLSEEEVPERHFPGWSMGYRQLNPADIARFPQYANYFQFGFQAAAFKAKPGTALELLELFSEGMG